MQIKAQGLLNAAKWIEQEYGRDGLRDVLHACSPTVRERYTSATAMNWHPVEELVEFLEQAERTVGASHARGKTAEAIGAAGARANMKGTLVRVAIFVSRPEALVKRIAALWSQYNDEGAMNLLHLDDHAMRVELTGLKRTHPLFCATLTGWCREIVQSLHAVTPVSKHIECKGRGDARCIFEVRYARVDARKLPAGFRRRASNALC